MSKTEWWQRGPVDGIVDVLQPVAHQLLQVRESVGELVAGLSESEWNARPANIASAAFHVRHITRVVDRLFTYARGEALNDEQFAALRGEGDPLAAKLRTLRTELFDPSRQRGEPAVHAHHRDPPTPAATRRRIMDEDPVIAGVLHLHGLHPLPLEARVRSAVEKVREQVANVE